MPELPEVETVRIRLENLLVGKSIRQATAQADEIVFCKQPADAVVSALEGSKVCDVGRKGKLAWIELDSGAFLYFHLGMSGWVRTSLDDSEKRLLNHGNAPFEDEKGATRFLKLEIVDESSQWARWTDGRRFGRIWLGGEPQYEEAVRQLGPDAMNDPMEQSEWLARLRKSKVAIKTWLLDQRNISGIGNWVADEVLYHARMSPKRSANNLGAREVIALRETIAKILDQAVSAMADPARFPADWMFHARWGGGKGREFLEGKKIVREPIGGRTTAWVPELQT